MSDPLDKRARAGAVEELRQKHFEKLEEIFLEMYGIVHFTAEDAKAKAKNGILPMPPENKDRVNAAKVCVQLLGISKPAAEKPAAAPPTPPTAKEQKSPLRKELLDAIDKKVGVK